MSHGQKLGPALLVFLIHDVFSGPFGEIPPHVVADNGHGPIDKVPLD